MKLSTLRRRTLRQARREYRRGTLTDYNYYKIKAVCNDDTSLKMLNEKIENEVNPWNGPNRLYGADWRTIFANIWDWFKENWPTILRIILTIAPLLLEPQQDEDS